LATHPAALDLPRALVEWMTMLVVTREGDRRCRLRPSQRAMVALMYLREHTNPAKIAAGSGTSESTTHTHTSAVIHLPAERAQGLQQALREADPDVVLLDGALAGCDRVGDSRANHSHSGTHFHREDRQPGPGRGAGTGRTRRRPPEALTDLPQIPMQPQPHDVNRQSHPHPAAATLKKLTGS
jgi:hypothetical protein